MTGGYLESGRLLVGQRSVMMVGAVILILLGSLVIRFLIIQVHHAFF